MKRAWQVNALMSFVGFAAIMIACWPHVEHQAALELLDIPLPWSVGKHVSFALCFLLALFGVGMLSFWLCIKFGEAEPLVGLTLGAFGASAYSIAAVGIMAHSGNPLLLGQPDWLQYLSVGGIAGLVVGLVNGLMAWAARRDLARTRPRPRVWSEVRLYTPGQVALSAFFGGPLAGALLIGRNYAELKEDANARAAVILGVLSTMVLAGVALLLFPPIPFPLRTLLALPPLVAVYFIARSLQGRLVARLVEKGIRRASSWKAAGVGVFSLTGVLVILMAAGLLWFHWKYSAFLELKQAVVRGQADKVRGIIADCPRVLRLRDPQYGDTALHTAASFDRTGEIVRILCDAGADVHATGRIGGHTPLHDAAFWGRLEAVRVLCDRGANVNVRNKFERTPLHEAAARGHTSVVSLLISKKAEVNARDFFKQTPLGCAAESGNIESVRILLAAGAEVNTYRGTSPALDAAERGQNEELASLLREYGAKRSRDQR